MQIFDPIDSRFATPDTGLAQFLVHHKHRLVVLLDDRNRQVFTFEASDALHADIDAYPTATVYAYAYARAGGIVRKCTKDARYRRAQAERHMLIAAMSQSAVSADVAEGRQ